jgi:LPS sulfotransferase NodH
MNSDFAVGTAIAALLARPDAVGDADAFIRAECAKAHRVAPDRTASSRTEHTALTAFTGS